MPLTTRSKGASTMTDPRILEVAPTKGCSKQIHDLLAGGRFLLVPGCFCVGPSQIVSLLILSGLHHDFGTFSWGIGNFIVLFLCSWSCRNRTLAFFGWNALLFTLFWWLYEWVPTWTCIFVCQRPWRNQSHVHKMEPRTGLRRCLLHVYVILCIHYINYILSGKEVQKAETTIWHHM